MSKPKNTQTDVNLCACGCGLQVAPKRLWVPGHDARAAGNAARLAQAGDRSALDALPTERLRAKAQNLADRWTAQAEAKATRQAERAALKASRETADA